MAGFHLTVRPTVFHPRYFLTSKFFSNFLASLDLSGKKVADVGTGSGILALAAARAGATSVVAIDINPNAAESAAQNAYVNGLGGRVMAVGSDLLSGLAPTAKFDVILSSPPSFAGEPRDIADRAWHAGPTIGILHRSSTATGLHPAAACMFCYRPIPIWSYSEISSAGPGFSRASLPSAQFFQLRLQIGPRAQTYLELDSL